MPKLKISKSIKKRFKISSTGKVLRHHAGRSHLLEKKSQDRKKKLIKICQINKSDLCRLKIKL
uniref:Large ribosomal subunit protein bL35c n=1 Tax=Batrachospermum sp. TaxID=31373 RepID=A0A8K1YUP1_9FLOR|nr:ribosomal protein L35 [Batrachospermum sp.]